MSKKIVIIILALVSVLVLINYLIIKPKSIHFTESQLKEEFNGYITYKNNQKGFYLYLVSDSAIVQPLHLDTMYESEAFNKPQLGGVIKHIIFADTLLYRASHIGDKIVKLPNSNKCLLISKKGTFRLNCYIISSAVRKQIGKIDEW